MDISKQQIKSLKQLVECNDQKDLKVAESFQCSPKQNSHSERMNSAEFSEILKESLSENKREFLESLFRESQWNASVWSEFTEKTKNLWKIPKNMSQTIQQQEQDMYIQESFVT